MCGDTHIPIDTCAGQKIPGETRSLQHLTYLWTFSEMTSKRKNGGYSVGTFVQKIAKTELIETLSIKLYSMVSGITEPAENF